MGLKRHSYASIELKKHKLEKDSEFDFLDTAYAAESSDKRIVDELFGEISENDLNICKGGTGEWLWLQNNKQKDFIEKIASKDIDQVSDKLGNMFRNDATYGYLSPSFYDVGNNPNMVKSDILHNIDSCIEFTGLEDLSSLVTPSNTGAPFGLVADGGVVLPDTPRHYYYAINIKRKLRDKTGNPLLVEIGGGYGGLCKILAENIKDSTIINIDLLPALVTSYYFLKKLGHDVVFIKKIKDWRPNKINLLSAENFVPEEGFNLNPELIFNSRSLCEMSKTTCDGYIRFVNQSGTKFFYHENSNYLLFPESERHIEYLADEFRIDKDRYSLESKCITPFTGGQGRYREYMYTAIA